MLEEILEDTQTSGSSDLHHSSQGETCSFFARAMSKLSRPAKFILGALGALGVFGYSMIAESSDAMAQSTEVFSTNAETELCTAPIKNCEPKILAAGNGNSTEGPYSNSVVKVDTCCRDDLSLEVITDAEKLEILPADKESKERIKYFSHKIVLLYPGKGDKQSDTGLTGNRAFEKSGHQYFERIIRLKDKDGNILSEVKNGKSNYIHFYVPSTYDLLPVTFYPKFAYTFDLWSMSSDLTMKDLPVRMVPGQGVAFAGTPFMASLKLGNPTVNDMGYAANIIFNTSFDEKMMSIAASLAFELKGNTSREIKFGCGLLGGYNHNQFVSKGLSRLSVGNIALMFYGDELGNGPFKKPFDDIEYQIMFGSMFSGESTGPDAGKYVLYISLGTEWFFDFARVGPVNLLGMHMNASIRPYMDYPLDEESTKLYDFDKKSDLWLIVGPKMRLEIDKWNNLRLDLKPAYFLATDFDRYIQGFLFTGQIEY